MKNKLLFLPLLLLHYAVSAQQPVPGDSSATLEEVQVRSFEQNRKQSQTAVNAIAIEFNNGDRNNKTALVSGFNTIAFYKYRDQIKQEYARKNQITIVSIPYWWDRELGRNKSV